MVTTVRKWGNSLAVRIPRSFAEEARLASGKAIELSVRDRKLIISAAPRSTFTLEELLAGVTKRNRHKAVSAGDPVGREVW